MSESTLDMYYKQPKKEEHGYHFDTVNVMSPESKKNQADFSLYTQQEQKQNIRR